MEIKHADDGKKGHFFIEKEGKQVAELAYVWAGKDKFIIDHTEVDKSLSGEGIGKKLVLKAVEMAKKKNLKIIPLCPFAKGLFLREPELSEGLIA